MATKGAKPKNNSKNPARDECGTPDYALEPLIPYLEALRLKRNAASGSWLGGLVVWESAPGEGLLVQHLKNAGCIVSWQMETSDYFLETSVPATYDVEVTNMPFSRKFEWIERAYALGKPFALLAPSDMLFAGEKAVPLFLKHGIEVLLPYQRIDYKMPNIGWGEGKKKSSAQMHTSWFTWGLGIGRMITYVHILKGKAREKALAQGLNPLTILEEKNRANLP